MTTPTFNEERGHGTGAVPPLLDLDDSRCADPAVAGGKAAVLCRARATGLPILSGVVVAAPVSRSHMARGRDALTRRGSGGARLEVSLGGLDDTLATELTARVAPLGDVLVVRSSSVLEMSGEWSGAFTSYLDISPEEVARAVTGCWASAFTVATLERYESAGVEPGSADMAILIQPALVPEFGGTARLEGEDTVITAVAGSPAPLVQGWEPGHLARVGSDGQVSGAAALQLMGETLAASVAATVRRAHDAVGSTTFEWAVVDGEVILLQLTPAEVTAPRTDLLVAPGPAGGSAREVARLARRYPGPLGEELVLPWALGDPVGLVRDVEPADLPPRVALNEATEHASRLTAEVWSRPRDEAAGRALRALRAIRGSEPQDAWEAIATLRRPDPERAALVLACMATVRRAMVEAGAITWADLGWYLELEQVRRVLDGEPVTKRQRIGFDRWEPFNAAVVMREDRMAHGVSAAPGIAFGRLRWIPNPGRMDGFRPRDVVVAPYPTPQLAALLWDAAAVVTTGGGPAAHLFESARALAIPAVAGAQLEDVLGVRLVDADGRFGLAVDGLSGRVFVSDW